MRELITYGQWLKEKRGRKGRPGFLSQQELANRVGVDRTYINRIERGSIRMPEDDLRQRIHGVFGSNDDELVESGVIYAQPPVDGVGLSRDRQSHLYTRADGKHVVSIPILGTVSGESARVSTKFGDWLKAKRGEIGSEGFVSQQRLARLVGIDRTYLTRIERGYIHLPHKELRDRIHRVLGTSDEDLRRAGVPIDPPRISDPDFHRTLIVGEEAFPTRPSPRTEEEYGDEEVFKEHIMIVIDEISDQGRQFLWDQLNLIREYFPYLEPEGDDGVQSADAGGRGNGERNDHEDA